MPTPSLAVAILAASALIAAGCGGDDGDDDATTEAATTTTGAEAGGHAGAQLYVEAGCAACHGEMAEGSDVGPALPGHSEEAVIRQARSPLDTMPAYSEARLSDEDLREIAEYIAGLEAEDTHVEPIKLANVPAMHHWMALSALDAGNRDDAEHHIDHIIDLVKGEHRDVMQQARGHLRSGDVHEAEHLIEEMLAGNAKPGLSLARLHLELAFAAVETQDVRGAVHHVGHFADLATGAEKQEAQELLDMLRDGNLHDTAHSIETLMGETPHGG